MKQFFYKIIYNRKINVILRNINKILLPCLPKKIEIPPSGIIKIKNNSGKQMLIATNQTSFLTKYIFWNKYQNFEYTEIFIDLIKKIKCFYDVGANIGFYSLIANMENDKIKIVSFEPSSGPLFYLKKNVRINKIKNIKVEPFALSDKNGKIIFYEVRNKKYSYLKYNLSGESNASQAFDRLNFVSVECKTIRLSDYAKENNDFIDLIKIDTEGTEDIILKSADTILAKMKPIVICEILFNKIENKLENLFKKFGYEFYHYTDRGLEKVDSIIRDNDNGVRNCFFVHPEKVYLIKDYIVNS